MVKKLSFSRSEHCHGWLCVNQLGCNMSVMWWSWMVFERCFVAPKGVPKLINGFGRT